MRSHHDSRPKGLRTLLAVAMLAVAVPALAVDNYGRTPFYPGQKPILSGFYPNPAVNPQTATTVAVADLVQQNATQNGFSMSDPRVTSTLKNGGLAIIGGVAGTVLTNAPTGVGVAAGLAVGGVCLGGSLGLGSFGCGMLGFATQTAVTAGVNGLIGWANQPDGTISTGGPSAPTFTTGFNTLSGTPSATLAPACSSYNGPRNSGGCSPWYVTYIPAADGLSCDAGAVSQPCGTVQPPPSWGNTGRIAGTGQAPDFSWQGQSYANLNAAVQALTDAQKAMTLNAVTLAALANSTIQAAQNVPGSLPPNTSNPVTEAQAQAVINSMGANAPTVGDLFAPVSAGAVANAGATFTPSGTISAATAGGTITGGSAPTQADSLTGGVTQPATSGNTTVNVNLGPDPGVGAPPLEPTPTASAILGPILNLMPDLKAFAVPAHTGTCPTASLTLLGHNYTIDSHCPLIESNRTLIEAALLLVWSIACVFIVLRA